jgi:beta-galactosidase
MFGPFIDSKENLLRSTIPLRLVAASAAATLLASIGVGVGAASAAEEPAPVGAGALFLEEFATASANWTAITGATSEWSVSDGAISIDTRSQSSGRYLRPATPLTLPDAYELRTSVKMDAVDASGTVTLLLDMRDTTNWKSTGISPQFAGFDSSGYGVFRISKPIVTSTACQGLSPAKAGQWVDLLVQRAAGVTAVYADGEIIGSVASPTAGGTIGFGAYKSKVSFGAISIDPLTSTPADHPTVTECPWTVPPVDPDPAPGTGEVSGDGEWVAASASTSDRPGHEVTDGQSTISLDGEWNFITDPAKQGESAGYHEPVTALGTEWRTLDVPGNWDVHDEFSTYVGTGWYRRTFESGDLSAAAGERARLKFGAVSEHATVWLNGAKLGEHRGGYTPFDFDVTDYLVDGENTLVVRADNTFQQGAWWSWGGISRSVELVMTGEVVVDRQQIVATPDLAAGTAHIDSTVFLENVGDEARTVSLTGTITDAATGAVVASGLQAQAQVPAGGSAEAVLSTELAAGSFQLWNVDDPNLYRLDLTLDSPADVDDASQSDRFGIRELEIDGVTMKLNGEVLKGAGANRVSDDPANGNVEPDWLVRRDLDRMKASGMNVTRIMHYPQTPDLLDYADEIGMLLIDEVPVWNQGRNLGSAAVVDDIKREFREMVERDFNHPSIFAHSVANEIISYEQPGIGYLEQMAAYSKQIDPTRFVTAANDKIDETYITDPEQDGAKYMDFVSVNMYYDFETKIAKVHSIYDDVPLFVTEFNPGALNHPIDRGWVDYSHNAAAADAFASKPYVFGWSQWTFNDYRSKFSGSSTDMQRGWGNTDVWGRLKAAYDDTRSVNAPAGLSLGDVTLGDDGGLGVVTVTPSGSLSSDGPSSVLRDYRVSLQAFDATGAVVGGTIVDLPVITPGDEVFDVPLSWDATDAATRVRATLLSPTGYEVAVSTKDAAKPAPPVIREVLAANGAIRVRFEDPARIGAYQLTATAPNGTSKSLPAPTRETFADLTGLVNGTTYTVKVTAIGADGTAGPAAEATATPSGSLGLAPRLVNLEPIQDGLVLGFSSEAAIGTWFQTEVSDAASGAVLATRTTKNRPGTRIEGLPSGTAVDVRIRQVSDQGAGSATSVWSERLRATPLGEQDAPLLDVHGLIAGSDAAGIVLTPSNRTERYHVTVTGGGIDDAFTVERAAVELLPIEGLAPDGEYAVSVTAEGAGGSSAAWSGTVRTRAETPTGEAPVPTGLKVINRGNDAFLSWDDSGADGYIVTSERCGATTSATVIGAEFALGKLGQNPGSYTVASVLGLSTSDATAAVTVPGHERCPLVVSTADTAARPDGTVPFRTTSTWLASALAGAGDHPSVYADLSKTPAATATWTAPKVTAPATNRIEVSLPTSSTSSKHATYTVKAADGDRVITVDQVVQGGGWVNLGEFAFDETHQPTVVLAGSGGFLRASAVRFTDTSTADLPTAPEPGFANQVIAPDEAITGTGTAQGNTVVVTAADGTVLGQGTVNADLEWSVTSTGLLPVGSYADAIVTETDADGWTGTATATIRVVADAPDLDVIATTATRCVAGKALVAVTVKNGEQVPVDVTLATAFGSKAFTAVASGKTAFHSFTTRNLVLPSGEATATVTATIDGSPVTPIITAPYEGRSCSGTTTPLRQ